MMSRGVVLVHSDQTIEMAPMQVWFTRTGARIRIGRNVYFFDADGRYDGSEHKMSFAHGSDAQRAVDEALRQSRENKGLAPEEAHYQEGTPGHREETAAWPFARAIPGGGNSLVPGKKGS
jgi:hypothetical protein